MDESKSRERNAAEVRQLISFTVGAEEYGLELLRVKEVIRMRQITWLPKAPPCVKGIINLRGDVIPIVDLRERFGLQAGATNGEHTGDRGGGGGKANWHGGGFRQPGGSCSR